MKLLNEKEAVGQTIKAVNNYLDLLILYESGDASVVKSCDHCNYRFENTLKYNSLHEHIVDDFRRMGAVIDGEILRDYEELIANKKLNDRAEYIRLKLIYEYNKECYFHEIKEVIESMRSDSNFGITEYCLFNLREVEQIQEEWDKDGNSPE